MINRNKSRILRDICLNHSARSDKDINRTCPTKLNKKELEDVYYKLADDNFRLKNHILSLEQQLRGMTTKLQRMSNAQRSILMKEKGSFLGSKALFLEQKELIEDLQLANQKLVEKIKLLNMQMCSAKQFINISGAATRCSKCFLRNSTNLLNSSKLSKRSESNLKVSTSCQLVDKEVMTTRSIMASVSINTEQPEPQEALRSQVNLSCEKNRCGEQIKELKQKICELEETINQAAEKHTNTISHLDHQGISLRQENVTLRSLNTTLEEQLQELSNKLRAAEVRHNNLSSEIILEKKRVRELETELKINAASHVNVARAIEEHMIRIKTEDSVKKLNDISNQLRVTVKSDAASKYSDDSGYIDSSKTAHSDHVVPNQNQELLKRIDFLQSQIDALHNSKELNHHSPASSPKRGRELLSKIEGKVKSPNAEEIVDEGTNSSPKRDAKLLAHSSTDSETKHDTIKHKDVDNTHFAAFFVNIENTSSPKHPKTTKETKYINGPANKTSNVTNKIEDSNINESIGNLGKIDKQKDIFKSTPISKSDKDSSIKSDTEKRDRTRTLSKSSHNKTSLKQNKVKQLKTKDNLDNVIGGGRQSAGSNNTYVVPGRVDSRSPDNTDCEMSSYSDLPSERDEHTSDHRLASILSPGEDRAVSSSDTRCTDYTSLSEGELPGYRTVRQLSLGEKQMGDVAKRDFNDNMGSKQNIDKALTAVSAELSRCRQLLRLSAANVPVA